MSALLLVIDKIISFIKPFSKSVDILKNNVKM